MCPLPDTEGTDSSVNEVWGSLLLSSHTKIRSLSESLLFSTVFYFPDTPWYVSHFHVEELMSRNRVSSPQKLKDQSPDISNCNRFLPVLY